MAVTNNGSFVVLPSAARTAALQSADFTNRYAKGVRVMIDATASSATPSVTFTIQGKTGQGDYYTLLASSAVTGAGNTELVVHPSMTASANAVAKNALGNVWRVDVAVADADSLTYSVYAEYLY